jgi:hypothetical protein
LYTIASQRVDRMDCIAAYELGSSRILIMCIQLIIANVLGGADHSRLFE